MNSCPAQGARLVIKIGKQPLDFLRADIFP